jgi:hypothetical protein
VLCVSFALLFVFMEIYFDSENAFCYLHLLRHNLDYDIFMEISNGHHYTQ